MGIAGAAAAQAQTAAGGASIVPDDLRPPLSPVLVLLDAAPSSIQRPTSPRSLAVALLAAAEAGDGIPRDVAFEIAPYWLVPHPRLGFDEYYGASLRQNLKQHLSVSLASSPRIPDDDRSGTTLGLGLRTLPLAGRPARALRVLRDSLLARQLHCLELTLPAAEIACADSLRDLALRIQRADRDRYGLVLEVASAYSVEVLANEIAQARTGRMAVWATPGYRTERGLEVMGIARFLYDHQAVQKDAGRERQLDAGGRVRWGLGGFALSAEAVGRFGGAEGGGPARTDRYSAMLEYRATDGTYLFYSLGKNFDRSTVSNDNLISLVGVALGLGEKPRIPLLRD